MKEQPPAAKICSQRNTEPLYLVIQRPLRLTKTYISLTRLYLTSSHPPDRFSNSTPPTQLIAQRAKPESLFTTQLSLASHNETNVNEVVQPSVNNLSLYALYKS